MPNSQKTQPGSEGHSSGAKKGSGSKDQQPESPDSRGASSFKSDQSDHFNKRTFNEESERTEHHKSSFKSARSLFESKTITGVKLSQTSNSSVMRSFQTVNQKSQKLNVSTLGNPERNKCWDTTSPIKQPPDKPDRKSKTASHTNDSSPSGLNSGEKNSELEENNGKDSKQTTSKLFDDLHQLSQQDSL